MAREVFHPPLERVELRDVCENQDCTHEITVFGDDRCSALTDRELRAVLEDQQGGFRGFEDVARRKAFLDDVGFRGPGVRSDAPVEPRQHLSLDLLQPDSQKALRRGVEKVDPARGVGADDTVADR